MAPGTLQRGAGTPAAPPPLHRVEVSPRPGPHAGSRRREPRAWGTGLKANPPAPGRPGPPGRRRRERSGALRQPPLRQRAGFRRSASLDGRRSREGGGRTTKGCEGLRRHVRGGSAGGGSGEALAGGGRAEPGRARRLPLSRGCLRCPTAAGRPRRNATAGRGRAPLPSRAAALPPGGAAQRPRPGAAPRVGEAVCPAAP